VLGAGPQPLVDWHPDVINLFRDLDPIRWRQLDHNPIALLREFTPERLAQRAAEMVLYSRINHAHRRLKEYMANKQTWAPRTPGCWAQAGGLFLGRVRHCTSRFRFIRAAWACSRATTSRAPAAWACRWWPSACSTIRAISSSSSTKRAISARNTSTPRSRICRWSRPFRPRESRSRSASTPGTAALFAKVWLMQVGRVKLYLLDCDVEGNSPQDRELTSRLYGGDERTRIRQELVLGVGGVRALRALGITPASIT
jgi:glycogen phosphorylase